MTGFVKGLNEFWDCPRPEVKTKLISNSIFTKILIINLHESTPSRILTMQLSPMPISLEEG